MSEFSPQEHIPPHQLPKKERGIYQKYHVSRVDGKPIKEGGIFLEFGDSSSWQALEHYADIIERRGYRAFAADIRCELQYQYNKLRTKQPEDDED